MKPNPRLSILFSVFVSIAFLTGCEPGTTPEPESDPASSTPDQPTTPASAAPTTPSTETPTTPTPKETTPKETTPPEETTQPQETSPETTAQPVSKPPEVESELQTAAEARPVIDDERVVLTTSEGVVVIGLYEREAPMHVANFKTLVREGFYDGSSFHRVVERFIAQGGQTPEGKKVPVAGAPSEAKLKHERGAVAMARSAGEAPGPTSDPTQFYICYEAAPELDERGNTVFGRVLQGFHIVNKFEKAEIGSLKGAGAGFLPEDKQPKILKAEIVPASGVAQSVLRARSMVANHKAKMAAQSQPKESFEPKAGDEYVILTLDIGEVVIDLFEEDAPKHAANFKKHVKSGFYDGLNFHRVIDRFMAQGGDPEGTGMGGPGYTIEAEIGRKHLRGSVAAARTGGPANPQKRSSGSQFYICFQDTPHLDGNYSVFGQVVKGMDVVDRIQRGQAPSFPVEKRTKILKAELVPASAIK